MATPTKTPIKNRVRPATDAGKADMSSVVFHELGNQLGIISGLSELLAQTPLSEEQQTLIEAVRQSAEVMRQLAADFRMVHELEDRAFPLNIKPFDLTLLAEHLALVAQLEADRKGLQVEVIVDERIPAKMIADPLRIHQVVANLLNNALKYTKKGAIRLEWSCLALTAGRLSLRTTVTDSGIGIPESELATIFDWHYRVAGSDVAGSGIGLALARRLVGEMGSELHVRSAPGQGTTFWFDLELPVWPAPPTPAAAAPPTLLPEEAEFSVLVVDDHRLNQLLVQTFLERRWSKVRIYHARTGNEAIGLLRDAAIDLVLLDLHLPIMNGWEALQYIREELPAPLADIPVLIMTALPPDERQAARLEELADGCLIKPFKEPELQLRVSALLLDHLSRQA